MYSLWYSDYRFILIGGLSMDLYVTKGENSSVHQYTRVDMKTHAKKVVIDRQIIINLSNNAVVSLKKLLEDDCKYGNDLVIKLNTLILDYAQELSCAKEEQARERAISKISLVSEIRDLFQNFIK